MYCVFDDIFIVQYFITIIYIITFMYYYFNKKTV